MYPHTCKKGMNVDDVYNCLSLVCGINLLKTYGVPWVWLQAYQVELESLAVKLEEENEKLLKEKVNFEI